MTTTMMNLLSSPTLRFLLQLSSPLLHVFLWNALHAVDLQLDVGSAGDRIGNAVYRFLMHLDTNFIDSSCLVHILSVSE